ncbi:hypothetical protein CK203_107563 [Vitis vinifera]|uniref:Reverse transcriptase zinc-binding domain-containing protein n=1 Tax=Vitis vinifera TaxID=29760 RepID=A0A438DC38_VITVI|nr:hypothetical protein CK203_107563 [Vitis vinifera]
MGHIPMVGMPTLKSDVTSLSLEGYGTSLSGFFQVYSVCGRRWEELLWEDLWWGDQPLRSQYPRLFRVVTDKNIPISSILGSARPFSWNFNFRRNILDYEIEDLECLMRSLDFKSFFIALFQIPNLSPLFPTKFVWNSQVPFKVKSFVWLVAHKKLAKMDWVPPRSISDMMSINYKGFDISKRGIVLWQNACIALIWVVWRERNVRIFEDKARNLENLWDSF